MGNKLLLYSGVVCRLDHLERLSAYHKRLVGNSRSRPASIVHRPRPILKKYKELDKLIEKLWRSKYLPSGERMYFAWTMPYISEASELSAMNCSFCNSSSLGAYKRFIKALHCTSLDLGRLSSLRHSWLNLSFKKLTGTGRRNSCPSSCWNHEIHERPGCEIASFCYYTCCMSS